MAEEVQIQGGAGVAKVRNPVAVALLPIVTLGIYGLVWYYKINKEMADLGKATGKTDELGDNPTNSILAVTLGALVIVPAILSIVHTFQRAQAAQRITGSGEQMNGWLGLVLALVLGPVFYAYIQSALNKVWTTQAVGSGPPAPAGITS